MGHKSKLLITTFIGSGLALGSLVSNVYNEKQLKFYPQITILENKNICKNFKTSNLPPSYYDLKIKNFQSKEITLRHLHNLAIITHLNVQGEEIEPLENLTGILLQNSDIITKKGIFKYGKFEDCFLYNKFQLDEIPKTNKQFKSGLELALN